MSLRLQAGQRGSASEERVVRVGNDRENVHPWARRITVRLRRLQRRRAGPSARGINPARPLLPAAVLVLPFLIAFAVSLAATPLCRAYARRRGLMDVPNDASSHVTPTPRNGGIAVMAGIAVTALVLLRGAAGWALLAPSLAMALLAAVDEIRPLPRRLRLVLQIGIAVAALVLMPSLIPQRIDVAGMSLPLGIAGAACALVWIVGSV